MSATPPSAACLFCDKHQFDGKQPIEEQGTKMESAVNERELFWICETCKSSEQERTRALEAALLLENLDSNITSCSGSTLAVAATNETSQSLSFSMTTTKSNSHSEAKCVENDPTPCSCQACAERRHGEMEYEQMREIQDLQKAWVTLRHAVRQLYRDGLLKDGSTTKGKKYDFEKLKELVNKLCSRDPHQLYQRLESQGREYVMELKVNMLHLLVSSESTAIFGDAKPVKDKSLVSQISLAKATHFLGTLMRSFVKFQQTVRNMSSFFLRQLEVEHLEKFGITWETVNRHLFESMIFQESLIQTSLPVILAQLGYHKHDPISNDFVTEKSHDVAISSVRDDSSTLAEPLTDSERLLSAWPTFERLMNGAKELWDMAQERMEQYTVEQMRVYKATLKAKQRMLREDLDFFKKQRRLLEEYVNRRKKKVGSDDAVKNGTHTDMATFTAQLRAVLTGAGRGSPKSHQSSPTVQCQNCKALHCPCDECAISHMIACGIISPEDEVEDLDLPLDDEELIRSLERSPTSSSEISSISDSGDDDDDSLEGFEDSVKIRVRFVKNVLKTLALQDLLNEKNARALCTDGEKMSEFRHKMASLLPSTLYTLHDHTESPSIRQHIENAYGEWETHLDPKARKLAFSHPACELLEKTLEQLNVAGKTDKEKYEIGYQMGVKLATAGLPPDELLKIKGDILRSHLQLGRRNSNDSAVCTQQSALSSTVSPARQHQQVKNKTETIKVATVRSRQCSTPSINSADNFDVAKGTISNTHTVSPANFHSSKIPADILEMLKDEKLSKALSAAAKRVRANGGGPSDFLLEAESIKKIYNSHFTSTLSHESTKTDTKEVKMVKTKESSTVATQVEKAENDEEPDDEDSRSDWSELSGGAGKQCDCCYCEVFGHSSNTHLGSNSQSYPLIRERLRRKLKQKQCESTTCMKNRKAFTPASVKPTESNSRVIVKVKGDESVDTLLEFINGNEEKKTKVKSNFETKLKNKKGKTRAKKEETTRVSSHNDDTLINEDRQSNLIEKPRSRLETTSPLSTNSPTAKDEFPEIQDSLWSAGQTKHFVDHVKDKDNQKGTAGQHEPEGKNRTTGTTKPSQRSAIIPLPKSQLHERRTEAFAGGLTESTIDKTESPLQHVRKVHQSKPIRSRSHIDVLETDEVPAMATRLTSPLKNNISKDLTSLSESSNEAKLVSTTKHRPMSADLEFLGNIPVPIDEVFKPKDINLEDLDETEREVESFKRFVFNFQPVQNRTKVNLNINILRNSKLGKQNSTASAGCF